MGRTNFSATPYDKPVTIEVAADFLGLTKRSLLNKLKNKKIPYHKPEGTNVIYFYLSELRQYIHSNDKVNEYDLRKVTEKIFNSWKYGGKQWG